MRLFTEFLKACNKREEQALKMQTVSTRVASSDDNTFKKFIKG